MNLRLDLGVARSAGLPGADDCDDGDLSLPGLARSAIPAPLPAHAAPAPRMERSRLIASGQLETGSRTINGLNDISSGAAGTKRASNAKPLRLAQNSADASPSPEPEKRLQRWDISPADKTLNAALARWASAAGWQLAWDLPVDYAVETRTSVTGSFEEAVRLVTKSMERAEIPLKAIFYEGNKVLRIVGKGVE